MKKYDTKNIRNICLIGHIGSGKTSVGEAILFDTGATTRLGSVLDGNSTFDFEPEEIKRQGTISTAFAAADWKKYKIQLSDTSGDANFFVDARNALLANDIAAITISAVDGVQVMTEKMFEVAQENNIPTLVVINKMDRERANFDKVIQEAQDCLSKKIAPLIIPIGAEDNFIGVVDVLKQKAYSFAADGSKGASPIDVPADLADMVESSREALIEVIAESDDDLMEKYLETMELSDEEIEKALPKAIFSGLLMPAVAVSSTKNVGIETMLDLICDSFPSPAEFAPRKGEFEGKEKERPATEDAPFSATIFKTVQDKFTGSLAICRIWSGTIDADTGFYNVNKGEKERFGQILVPFGKKQENVPKAGPGDIVAFAKLKVTKVGDIISDESDKISYAPLPVINPLITYAVHAKDKNEEDKLGQALNRVAEEDPTIHIIRNKEVRQTQIAGMGQVHIDTTIDKIKRIFDIDVELLPPRIPYRETIRKKVEGVEGKHKKQSGGRGQFGVCYLNVEPNPGKGFEFVDAIVGGSIPRQWIPSVEKGIVDRMGKGVIAGYQVVDVKVTLYDGKYHDVDSSDAAFQMAGSKGFKAATEQAAPYLLEPIWNLEVVCPEECMGDVMGDISSRRGKVQGMEAKGKNQVVKAQAPMAELLRYAPDLKSITGGRGTFAVEFSHYEEVPREIQDKVVASFSHDDDE
ncbi:MAG: elongation factor G [Deltaproteobacteria bacterium]|nr:elongation factor G [Deltaproteobacteria bacterium]MBN2674661.1 elongation factor G [Deltaproteobacteria bacterium]